MKKETSFGIKTFWIAFGVCLFMIPQFALSQSSKQYRFTNNTGVAAKDLHVKISPTVTHDPNTGQTPPGTFPDTDGIGASTMGFGTQFGGGVAAGGNVVLNFGYDGSTPRVIEWWWTSSGDPSDHSAANRIGKKHFPRRGQFDFVSAPSTGDGMIEIIMGGEVSVFEMPPGLNSDEMATTFADFIDNTTPWGGVDAIDGSIITMFSTALSEELDDFTVNISPDTTMNTEFKYMPEVIPTLTEWGVIILLLLVVAIGIVFLYQRKTALAIAGVSESSAAKPKLFDGKVFTKVYAVVLLIGAAGLVAAYLYFGSITSADPFGVVVSSGIIAYMAHLWLLKKS